MLWKRMKLEFAMLATIAVAGCAEGDRLVVDDGPMIPTDVTTPAEAVESHVQALNSTDYDAYRAMLEKPDGSAGVGFRFHIRSDDADDFPWLSGTSWGYDMEMELIHNMMDPAYAGVTPPVEEIEMAYTLLDERPVSDGLVRLTVDADITVLDGIDGWVTNTRLEMLLARDSDGFYRIRSVNEMPILVPASDQRPESASWGRIKAQYRNGSIPVDLAEPRSVIESHARAFNDKNLEAYLALLAPDFRFYVRDDDAQDLPWISGDSWGLEDETRIISNMMDPNFAGLEDPVETIEFEYAVIAEREVSADEVWLTLDADVRVLVSPNRGWLANTRFEFSVVRDSDGFFRLRDIKERAVVIRSEEASFGSIKALYWTRLP
jgi:hypothetical protein